MPSWLGLCLEAQAGGTDAVPPDGRRNACPRQTGTPKEKNRPCGPVLRKVRFDDGGSGALVQGILRLHRGKLQRYALVEMTNDCAAHGAERDGCPQCGLDVDLDGST